MSKLKALSLVAVAALTSSVAFAEEVANTTTENTMVVTEQAKTENTAAK